MEAATGGQVSSFELLPQCGLDLVLAHLPAARSPLGGRHEWQVLIEADTARPGDPLAAIVQQALADALEAGEIADAVVAQSAAQAEAFWLLRESMSEAERRAGPAAHPTVQGAVGPMTAVIPPTHPH